MNVKFGTFCRLSLLGIGILAGCNTDLKTVFGGESDLGPFYVKPGFDVTVSVPVECISANECDYLTTTPCERAVCDAGKCAVEPREPGQLCTDNDITTGECEMTRCDGAGACVAAPAVDGAPCGVLNICEQHTCVEGACTGSAPRNCSDDNPCTTDSCDPATGCTSKSNSDACNDGDDCTSADACKDGACTGKAECECLKNSDCDALDTDKCNGVSTCVEGKCENDPKTAVTCPTPVNGETCEESTCNPATGKCSVAVVEYKLCDDEIACTTKDYCNANGKCISKTVTCEFLCSDEKDDDGDQAFDCDDEDCENDSACSPPCLDDLTNGDETDKNCGGDICGKCKLTQSCLDDDDCESDNCESLKCAEPLPTCSDEFVNGNETDEDCGGASFNGADACKKCGQTKVCVLNTDCESDNCVASDGQSRCDAPLPNCDDKATNGDESDVDCGGTCTKKCADTQFCKNHADCLSGYCEGFQADEEAVQFQCAPLPPCQDSLQNFEETDVDCGGGTCEKCDETELCGEDVDCKSDNCVQGEVFSVCGAALPPCENGKKDGLETFTDCGGGTCKKCAQTNTCKLDLDCQSDNCVDSDGTLACGAPLPNCDDKLANGDESDVDCGGTCTKKCDDTQFCKNHSDCTSSYCEGFQADGEPVQFQCAPLPPCQDGLLNFAETDVDCGGGTCEKCDLTETCGEDLDCESDNCVQGEIFSVCGPALPPP